jgi:hypothetical protein
LVRGNTERGEVCEIPGIGPIPVATARALLTDSVLSVIVTKGVEIVGVAHAGRTIRANVRRAVEDRSPRCDVPDCPVDHGLEIDHVTGYAITKDTKLDDLARLCAWHHYLKTHHRYRITGPPAARQWLPPESTERTERAERAPPAAA